MLIMLYVHSKQLYCGHVWMVSSPHFSRAGLDLLNDKPVLSALTFDSNWNCLETAEEETKVCGHSRYWTQDLWLLSQTNYPLQHVGRLNAHYYTGPTVYYPEF